MSRARPSVLLCCSVLTMMAGPAAAQHAPHPTAASLPPAASQDAPRVRTYYVAADEVLWNYAPSGMDQTRGIPIDSARPRLRRPGSLGTTFKKAVYREYTDASFSTLKPRPPEWEHLGIMGPLIRGVVGDTIKVVFRNNATKPYSVHPHGVFYNKDSEGTPYRDGTTGADKADDAVPPGGTHTYVWAVPERAGPGPHDGSSIMWMYHSHVEEGKDVPSGLMGPMIITARGRAKEDGSPVDVDREIVAMFMTNAEGMTQYTPENIRRAFPLINADSLADDADFQNNGNFFDTINGFIWGNTPGLTVEEGQRVRWYLMASTREDDFHTPHWHGNTVLVNGMRMDIVGLEPMTMLTADMVADNPGIWLFHCHLKIHLENGMAARYTVLPKDGPARVALLEASRPILAKASPDDGRLPGDWRSRPDLLNTRPDQLHFASMGDGVHATMGPAAIFYEPSRTAQGSFRAHASFTQTRATEHPEAYGLFVGGRDLESPRQSYLYFVVRQDGKYLIKHRTAGDVHTLVDWTEHPAIHTLARGATAPATNDLQVEVGPEQVRFLVNGTEVASIPRDARYPTDGVVGLRINHQLDVHVAAIGVEPIK